MSVLSDSMDLLHQYKRGNRQSPKVLCLGRKQRKQLIILCIPGRTVYPVPEDTEGARPLRLGDQLYGLSVIPVDVDDYLAVY